MEREAFIEMKSMGGWFPKGGAGRPFWRDELARRLELGEFRGPGGQSCIPTVPRLGNRAHLCPLSWVGWPCWLCPACLGGAGGT